eukprot:TRINITY_DN1229_c0_g1_i1.p1 TRINITY_DN1229_c0_g1~~TRINITY_DN1229_c0_g1_i1.p1  ORF type:complete len:481 (-),score=137.91 TRINITY_DN1229_c0_g1_i1:85-1527(-)
MNLSALLAVFCIVSFCISIDAHSYPGCTKLIGAPESRDGTCVGHIQGIPSRNIYGVGFDGMMTQQIPFGRPETKLCKWTHGHYENVDLTWANRAVAVPGERLWFKWNDFGHHPGGNYPGPSNWTLYWNYNDPSVDFNELNAEQFLARRAQKWLPNPERSSLLFPSPSTEDFLDPTCRTQRVPCIHQYTIPADTRPGIYSFFWLWDLEGYTRTETSNIYTACFDVEVRTSHPTGAGAPFAAGNRFQLTFNGQFIVNNNGALTLSATGGANSYFTTTVSGPGLIGLQSVSTSRFLSVQPSGNAEVNRGSAGGSWELLYVNQLADGSYTLKSLVHGTFLTVNGNTVSFTRPEALSAANFFRVPGAAPVSTPAPAPAPTAAAPTPAAQPAALTPPESVKTSIEGTVTLSFPQVAGASGYRVHIRPTANGVRGAVLEFNFGNNICDAGVCHAPISTQRSTASFAYAIAATNGATVSAYTDYAQFN